MPPRPLSSPGFPAPSGADARTRPLVLLVFIALCLFSVSPLHSALNNPNENVRVYMVKSLVDHGTFAVDPVLKTWGYTDDKATRGGRMYSSKAPLISLLGAAAYALVRPFTGPLGQSTLTRVVRMLALAPLALWLLWQVMRRFRLAGLDPVVRDLTIVNLVLGSSTLAYLHVFSGHAIAALGTALCAAVLWCPRPPENSRRDDVIMGLAAALVVASEYPGLLAVLPLLLARLWQRRTALLQSALGLLAGGLVPTLLTMWAHTAMFGAPHKTGYSFIENRHYRALHQNAFFGIGMPKLDPLVASLFSPEVGLFFFTPLLILGVPAALALARRPRAPGNRVAALCTVVGTAAMLAFIAGHAGWRGGWVVGPRYISELVGLLIVPCTLWLSTHAHRRWLIPALLTATVLAVVHSGLGGLMFPHFSEVYKNPVYAFALPMWADGFSPDTWLLWLGAPARLSALWLGGLLIAPVLTAVWPLVRTRYGVVLTSLAAAAVTMLLLAHILPSAGPRAALETRHLMDLWSPPAGIPFDTQSPQGQTAIDRAQKALRELRTQRAGSQR